MHNSGDERIIREFKLRKTRQLYAITMTIGILVAVLWKHSHPGLLLGELSKPVVLLLEIALIGGFIAFTAANWRCPACSRYLGPNINQMACRRCKARLR